MLSKWKLTLDTFTWDNDAKSGDIKPMAIGFEGNSPTEARYLKAVLPLDANSISIVQGDVAALDMYSEELSAWIRVFHGEVREVTPNASRGAMEFVAFGQLYSLEEKEIVETLLAEHIVVDEYLRAFASTNVTLSNVNELVWHPLDACLVREPLLITDECHGQTYPITHNGVAPVDQIGIATHWMGQSWVLSDIVIFVEDWSGAGYADGTIELDLRTGTSTAFSGGVVTNLGSWPLTAAPNGPTADRYGNNRYYINFSGLSTTKLPGWGFLELTIKNATGARTVNIEVDNHLGGAGKATALGQGHTWIATYPGAGTLWNPAGFFGKQVCCEIWGNNWRKVPAGQLGGLDEEGEPQWLSSGYYLGDDRLNSTGVLFSHTLDGSIESSIKNVHIFYSKGWQTLSTLLSYLWDNYASDCFDLNDIAGVTDDTDWPDHRARYTNLYACLKGICDRTDLVLESQYDLGTTQATLFIEDRAVIATLWAAYSAAQQGRRTLKNGVDDTTARKTYSKISSLSLKKNNYRNRTVYVTVVPGAPKAQAAAAAAVGGGVTEWDAFCDALGRGVTVGVVGDTQTQHVDLTSVSKTDAFTVLERYADSVEGVEEELEVHVTDLDPAILYTLNQVLSITDSTVGLSAEMWLLRGFRFVCEGAYDLQLMFEKQVTWRGATEMFVGTGGPAGSPAKGLPREAKGSTLDGRQDLGRVTDPALEGPPAQLGPGQDPETTRDEVLVLGLPILWSGTYNSIDLDTCTQIAIGNSNATNSLTAMDNQVARRTCTTRDVSGKGRELAADFYYEDLDLSSGNNLIKEVALLDAGNNVIYRRAFKAPAVAGWYFNGSISVTKRTRLHVVVCVKD